METCVNPNCTINGGKCDRQHRCKICHGYIHIICGHSYFDDKGNEVEDLAFPKICGLCINKHMEEEERHPGESTVTNKDDEDESDVDSEEYEDEDAFFTKGERENMSPGWFIPRDFKRNEDIALRFTELKEGITSRTKLINKIVHVPASVWGVDAAKWWNTDRYTSTLRVLSVEQMRKQVVLVGKIIQKGKGNTYEVAFLANERDDELSDLRASDIRKFLLSQEQVNSKKNKNKNKGPIELDGSDEEEINETELIELDEFDSEDDLQAEDGSAGEEEEEEDDDEEEEEEDTSVPDELFLRIEPRTKIERKWKPEIDVRATNYSRPIQPSHINNVPRGGWATIPHSELLIIMACLEQM